MRSRFSPPARPQSSSDSGIDFGIQRERRLSCLSWAVRRGRVGEGGGQHDEPTLSAKSCARVNWRNAVEVSLVQWLAAGRRLANTLPNSQWKAFAAAFNFVNSGATPPSSASAVQTTTSDFVEQQLESDQGDQDVGVQLALYFQRVAPTVTSEVGILADPNLLQVAATIMGLPPAAAADLQPQTLSELMPLSDLQDPAKLNQLTERFTAMYDYTYGPSSGATSDLTVDSGNSSSGPSGAAAVLASVISSNGSVLGSALNDFTGATQPIFSTALMSSMSRLTLGG